MLDLISENWMVVFAIAFITVCTCMFLSIVKAKRDPYNYGDEECSDL